MVLQAPEAAPKIETTKEWDRFKLMVGNRPIDPNHVKELKHEMEVNPHLFASNPIQVNEHMYIIDGQHRRQAAKELGRPVYYVVVTGITLNETRTLNVTQRRWTLMDFARSFADSGRKDYKTFIELHKQFTDIAPSILRLYLVGARGSNIEQDFRRGDFEIGDLNEAKHYIEQLDVIRHKGRIKLNNPIASAFLQLFRKHEVFDFDHFVTKLDNENARELLRPQPSLRACLRSIEEVYNFQSKYQKRLY